MTAARGAYHRCTRSFHQPRRRRSAALVLIAAALGVGFGLASTKGAPGEAAEPVVQARVAPSSARPDAQLVSVAEAPEAVTVTTRSASPRVAFCLLPPQAAKLPPDAVRGLAHHLHQYPALSVATAAEREAAIRLRGEITATAATWRDPRGARADGYDTGRKPRRAGTCPSTISTPSGEGSPADGLSFDARLPKSVIYANAPGRPLVLVGVMFSMKRGAEGPTSGGPITRWHWHRVCARGDARGVKPLPDGACPPGARLREGSEMMHVWFTKDLRSAFAIHAPEPELCAAGLLPAGYCDSDAGA